MTYAVRDCLTMLRRNLRWARRFPAMTAVLIGLPVIILLLFVYVFGGTMGAGLAGDRGDYADYVTPGILMLAIAGTAQGTAIAVATDMKEGIIARYRTMAIFRPSVLAGHVLGSLTQTMAGLAVVIGVAVAVGFRPTAGVVEWLATAGLLALVALAMIWLSVGLGLWAKTVESASNLPMPLMLLPFLGSGFVPTDSMPAVVRWFAENQPFTPMMETLRGLLLGTGIGNAGLIAAAWCVAITLVGYRWSVRLYNRDPA
ncbi:ABC transporter permease [Luedemannella helvata]|uniref:Transport permease protein n=1 Tax=Luedemannella helvata TaxID=349315 RepID=A0ABP4VZH4_9ACTN